MRLVEASRTQFLKTTFILLLFATSVFAQHRGALDDRADWVRFESPARDFSVALPETRYLVDTEDESYRLHYLSGNVAIRVDFTPTSDAKDDFKLSYRFEQERQYRFAEKGDFLISQFVGRNDKTKQNIFWLHLASSKGAYLIRANVNDSESLALKRFISSIRLGSEVLYSSDTPFPVESRSIMVSSLKPDAVILEALQKPDSKQRKLEKAGKVVDEKDNQTIRYSREMVILRKPRVETDSAKNRVINGTVKLRVTFLASGQVGDVVLLKALDPALDSNAFKAARKIKFLPAEIDGKAVDVTTVIEYSFSIYSVKRGL